MARPTKAGIDYFPLDVRTFQDDKLRLIKSEFGAKGLVIFLNVLCDIYGENGYYKKWDNDSCLLMSEGVGCDCVSTLVDEVIKGCFKRSLFDKRVFEMFGVLTSTGIQKRYIRAISTRENIYIIKEYLLLNLQNSDEIPSSLVAKIKLKSINLQNNDINLQINEVDLQKSTQSKVKKSKVKKSKEKESKENIKSTLFFGEYKNVQLSENEYAKLKELYSDYKQRIERLGSYMASTGKTYKSHYATIRVWARNDEEKNKNNNVGAIASKYTKGVKSL